MKLAIKKSPVVTSKNNKLFKGLNLLVGLLLVLIASLILTDKIGKAIAIVGTTILVSALIEVLYALNNKNLKKFKDWKNYISPLNTALTLALLIPISASIFHVVIATVVAVYLGKLIYGGENSYIFNPAVLGLGLAFVTFGWEYPAGEPTQLLKYIATDGLAGRVFDIEKLLVGNYTGIAIGTTCAVLLIGLLVYYMVVKVVDWKISLTYLLTCAAMTALVYLMSPKFESYGLLEMIEYHLLSGYILFAATFLLSDPTSSPTTREAKIIYAVVAGIFTMAIRFIGSYSEGVIFAVLLANMLTPLLSSSFKRSNVKNLLITCAVCALLVVGLGLAVGYKTADNIKAYEPVTAAITNMVGGIL